MRQISENEIRSYVEKNIQSFHSRRLENLSKQTLNKLLSRKNPYLYKAKNLITAQDLVKSLLDAHLSSQEEGIFGDFLEGLAIFICSKTLGGWKSGIPGIDLEFERDETRYIVNIKSGPNWGNSSQIKKMKEEFRQAKRTIRTSGHAVRIEAVNGCSYGRQSKEDKGEYLKLCGESFWTFISGIDSLYTDIIEPLGYRAKQRNETFQEEYGIVINRFTREFIDRFCRHDGKIDWKKLVKFNSGKKSKSN